LLIFSSTKRRTTLLAITDSSTRTDLSLLVPGET
jgi:hypothetical protein